MADYAVLPSNLNLIFVRGDEFGILLDFSVDLTGYQFQTVVFEVAGVVDGQVVAGPAAVNFTLTEVDLSAGEINLSLQENQTQAFDLTKTYRWYLRWVAPGVVTRTVLSGAIVVGDP
jgi:hypothetical protein